jgi:hypothetical protein
MFWASLIVFQPLGSHPGSEQARGSSPVVMLAPRSLRKAEITRMQEVGAWVMGIGSWTIGMAAAIFPELAPRGKGVTFITQLASSTAGARCRWLSRHLVRMRLFEACSSKLVLLEEVRLGLRQPELSAHYRIFCRGRYSTKRLR